MYVLEILDNSIIAYNRSVAEKLFRLFYNYTQFIKILRKIEKKTLAMVVKLINILLCSLVS